MSDFDPDAFLAKPVSIPQGDGLDFDPDAFLSKTPDPTPTLDAFGTGAMHFARQGLAGLGDKATAALQALGDVRADKTGKVKWRDAYNNDLAFLDKTMQASDAAHPVARWVGNGLGFGANMGLLAAAAPAQAAGAAPTLAQLSGQGAKVGTLLGAAGGFGADRSQSTAGTVGNTVLGGALGAGIGAATPYVSQLAGKGLQAAGNKLGDLAGFLKVNSIHPVPTLAEEMENIPGGVPAVGKELLQSGIGGITKAGTAKQVDAAFDAATTKASALAANFDAKGGVVDLAGALSTAKAKAQQLMNEPATADAGKKLQALVSEYAQKYGSAGNPTTATASATEALATKRALGRLGYGAKAEFKLTKNPVTGDFAAGVRDFERAVDGALDEHLGPEFEQANTVVRRLGGARQAAERSAAKTPSNHLVGLLPYLAGLGGAGIGEATGHAGPTAAAYGLGALLAGKYGAQAGARGLYSLGAKPMVGLGDLLTRSALLSGPVGAAVGEQGGSLGPRLIDLIAPQPAMAQGPAR